MDQNGPTKRKRFSFNWDWVNGFFVLLTAGSVAALLYMGWDCSGR